MMEFTNRIALLQKKILPQTALFISDPAHFFYFTGIPQLTPEEREGFLLISSTACVCILTPFSPLPKDSSISVLHLNTQSPFPKIVHEWSVQNKIQTLFLDSGTLFLSEFEVLKKHAEKISLKLLEKDEIDELRMKKSASEIEALRKANTVTHQSIKATKLELKKGVTEKQVKLFLENFLREHGVEEMAFPTIVAFGEHSAIPHHQPTDRKLNDNEVILIDIGAKWDGYCADVTRTFWFGNSPSQQFTEIENIVKKAYAATLQLCNNHIRTTIANNEPMHANHLTAKDLDNSARSIITESGYGPQFIHTTGHGVGIVIHEQPSLNWKNDTLLFPGFTITIEPGIYLPKQFGYRFENSIVLRDSGCEELGVSSLLEERTQAR